MAFQVMTSLAKMLFDFLSAFSGHISTYVCRSVLSNLAKLHPPSWSVNFDSNSYDANYDWVDPPGQSIQAVVSHRHLCWHVHFVTTHRDLEASDQQQHLKNLCRSLNFDTLSLIDDTVTRLLIIDKPTSSQHTIDPFSVEIEEDPQHVRFPSYTGGHSTPRVQLSQVKRVDSLALGVHTAYLEDREVLHVYKEIQSELYTPRDSYALEEELRALETMGGSGNIVKLIGAVISSNPYKTHFSNSSDTNNDTTDVLRGILIEYHPKGTLSNSLHLSNENWRRWAIQLIDAIISLHEHERTHMDLKLSNILIDRNNDICLIDIGGAGGVTPEWVSPAMQDKPEPLSESFTLRKENDVWAIGKVLISMVDVIDTESQGILKPAAQKVMDNPSAISLHSLRMEFAGF